MAVGNCLLTRIKNAVDNIILILRQKLASESATGARLLLTLSTNL